MRVGTVILLMVATTTVAMAVPRWRTNRRRGCPSWQQEENMAGKTFQWTRTGLRDDGLQATFGERAFAPDDQNVVHKYPMDRMDTFIGLQNARVVYDYTTDNPVAVIRMGMRGYGPVCVILEPEYASYEELMQTLQDRNMTNTELPGDEAEYTLQATQTTDGSNFSQFVRDMCSSTPCGRPIDAVYYTTELVTGAEVSPAEQDESPVFLLLEDRVAIAGLDANSAWPQRGPNSRWNWRGQGRRQHLNGAPTWGPYGRHRGRHHRHGHYHGAGMMRGRRWMDGY